MSRLCHDLPAGRLARASGGLYLPPVPRRTAQQSQRATGVNRCRCAIEGALAALSLALALTTEGSPPAAPPRPGQEIFQTCLLCHSTKEMQRGPILDGLPTWYTTNQLVKFRDGMRGTNAENRSAFLMTPAMSLLRDDEEFRRVAEYIASLPRPNHLKTIRGDSQHGKVLFLVCVSCHGADAEGKPELKAPPLNGLEDWYLLDQLKKFKAGQRGEDPRDFEGTLMRRTLDGWDAKDMRDVVRYIVHDLARTNTPALK